VSDINEAGGFETVRHIERSGGRAAFFHADVRDRMQVDRLVRFGDSQFGRLSVFVNNASAPFRPSDDIEIWVRSVETDLLGAMYGTRAAIDAMRRHGKGGSIVNIASISALWHGRTRLGGSPDYDAAKAGVIRMTTALGPLGAAEGIRVNAIAPGWIAVPEVQTYWEGLTPQQRIDRGAPEILLRPDQIAAGVMRLATDETLSGRVLVWWSEDAPGLIPLADRGYSKLDPIDIK
jgi:3-oxoacyl-[acyl-carrier protein] reductase